MVIEEEVDDFSDYVNKNLNKKGQPGETGKNFSFTICLLIYPENSGSQRSVSYTHLTLPTTGSLCRSRWSPYH